MPLIEKKARLFTVVNDRTFGALYRYRSCGEIVPAGTDGSDEPRPSTSSISCSTTVIRLNVSVELGLPGLVRLVFRPIVPSGWPGGGLRLMPTALRFAVFTLIIVDPLTGLPATFGSSPTAVASSPVLASAFSAARNEA